MYQIKMLFFLTLFCFCQAQDWIYFNNMKNFEYIPYLGPVWDHNVTRISPDGSINEIILENVEYSDISDDGTKLLYIDYEQIENINWNQVEPVSFSIYNTETSETISSITGISPTYARFTHDENIALYMEGSQYSIWQLYKYSFADSSSTMLSDSLSSAFDNMTLSPTGDKVLSFKITQDENTEDYYMNYEVIVSDIETGESTTLATIPYYKFSNDGIGLWDNSPIWSDNGFIYLTFLDDNNCAQLIAIHSSLGYITQLTDNPCTSEISGYCVPSILNTKETNLDKFIYSVCFDLDMNNGNWIYDIESGESSYLGSFGGDNYISIVMSQSWSPDGAKVSFNERILNGWFSTPGYMRVYDTVTEITTTVGNVLNIDDPESYHVVSPIIWLNDTVVGDVNSDNEVNVLDVVSIVGYVLGSIEFDDNQINLADLNNDENIDVLDIVQLVNIILN